jgi:hypothetical protein
VQGERVRMTAGTIPVEVVAWVTKFVGGNGSQRRVFAEPLPPGATVRSVLRGLSTRFPELQQALWNGDELGEHIEVLVNDAVLGVAHGLDSEVTPVDQISLVGAYLGGADAPCSGDAA